MRGRACFNGSFNEALQDSLIWVELLRRYDYEKFQKIVLPHSKHVSTVKQEGVGADITALLSKNHFHTPIIFHSIYDALGSL